MQGTYIHRHVVEFFWHIMDPFEVLHCHSAARMLHIADDSDNTVDSTVYNTVFRQEDNTAGAIR